MNQAHLLGYGLSNRNLGKADQLVHQISPTPGIYQGGWMTIIFQKVSRIKLFYERMSLCESGS